MARYIDADALEKEMLFWSDTYGYGGLTKDNIRDIIKSSPAADVVERKRGKWEDVTMGRWIYAKCSVCGTVHDTKTKFCPNCGAQMCERGDE